MALSDSDGDSVQSYEYSVYGQVAAEDPNFIANPYMFTGRRFDFETGLYYYRTRYYNPYIGRFLQTDPVGYGDGINWYAYCGNNPIGFVDPSGRYPMGLFWIAKMLKDLNDMNDSDYLKFCDLIHDVNKVQALLDEFDTKDLNLPTASDILEWFVNTVVYGAPSAGAGVGAGALAEALIELEQQKINKEFKEKYPDISKDLGQEYFKNKGPVKKIADWWARAKARVRGYIPPPEED